MHGGHIVKNVERKIQNLGVQEWHKNNIKMQMTGPVQTVATMYLLQDLIAGNVVLRKQQDLIGRAWGSLAKAEIIKWGNLVEQGYKKVLNLAIGHVPLALIWYLNRVRIVASVIPPDLLESVRDMAKVLLDQLVDPEIGLVQNVVIMYMLHDQVAESAILLNRNTLC